jgi:hypothetical protein
MKMFLKYAALVLVLSLTILNSPNLVLADGNPGDYLHSRTYVGVVGTSVSVGNTGLFSGTNYSVVYSPGYDVSVIPTVPQAFGWGILAGHREEAYALEVSYWQSTHNGTFGPAVVGTNSGASVTFSSTYPATSVYNSINVDFKRYFLTDLQLQPFLDLGVSFPWMTISNADVDGNGNVLPLTLSGVGVNLGIGVEYYLTPNISFIAGAYQRWASFSEFQGSQIQYNSLAVYGPNGTQEGSGLNFAVGTTLGFE